MNSSRTETKLKKADPKAKKKDDVSKLSPTHSEVEEPITLKVIDGEDVQALAIKENDLKKLIKPKILVEDKTEDVLVKKKNKNAYPTIEVKVAKLVPEKPLKPIDTSENLGIRYNKDGDCMPHSILGSVEDYLQESLANGKSLNLPPETIEHDKPKADLYIKHKKNAVQPLGISDDGGEKALHNWKYRMSERKLIQNNLSKSLNRPINDLVMNQAEMARANMEIKNILDRTLPLVENGKGARLGSEFWHQPFLIGKEDNGIFTTLTQSEKGNIPAFEQIARPDFKDNQPTVVNYPWNQSKYLKSRIKDLEPLINELIPIRPEFENLQVVGQNMLNNNNNNNNKTKTTKKNDTWSNPVLFDLINGSSKGDTKVADSIADPFFGLPDVIEPPIFGPCIVFGGQTARWSGGDEENVGIVALESRLNFETKAAKRVLATFEIFNIGTTVIYYDWKKLNELNPFDIVNKETQKFYFDNRSNVIMPGDLLKIHVVFKSIKGGIFTEKWEFCTQPKLLSGASLILTLRGVAIQEDKYKKTRELIEKKLFSREAEIVVKNIVDFILSGVKTPERSQSPTNAYITEEEIFKELNPEFFYDHESFTELKKLYIELDPNGIWDLSINTFKSSVMSLDESDGRKQDLLFKLNSCIANMSFSLYSPNFSKINYICYNIVCRAIDDISAELYTLKDNMNLTFLVTDEYPIVDEFNITYENWKKENEIFKQQEIERKNRLEKEKNKEKDKSGKKQDAKKDDKKKEADAKKTSKTPIQSAKQTRTSREQTSSRSTSQMLENKEDRTKTPATNLMFNEEQLEIKKTFTAKAHLNVYQMLATMVDEIATVIDNSAGKNEKDEKLANTINRSKTISIPLNSDFI